jgi:two-component system response regulator YesN
MNRRGCNMKKGRMFYRVFIPILILAVGLVASFGSYIYLSTTNSVIERFSSSKQSYIEQIKNNMENKIQRIEYAFNTYSTTSSFQDVVRNPITEQDFVAYRDVNTQLNYIASMGLEGTEYSLISLVQDWKISNGSLSYLSESDRQKLNEAYIVNKDQGLFWIKTDKGIRFVNTLPVFSKNKQAIALSDISLQTLNDTIKTEENATVFILNKQGDLMYESDPEKELFTNTQLQQISNTAGADDGDTGMLTQKNANHQSVQFMYAKSKYNNWIYLTILDQKEISNSLRITKFGLFTMGLVLMIFIVVVAYIISVFFTKPILQIKRSLTKVQQSNSKNEIEWIIDSIDSIITEKESLESLIYAEMPQLETQLILNLFRNRIAPEELVRKLLRFGYQKTENQLYVTMLIQLDNFGGRESSDKDVLLLATNKIVEDLVPKQQRMIPIILNDNTQATILSFTGMNEQEINKKILDYAKALLRAVNDYLHLSISIGISTPFENLLESKKAAEMSKLALHQRLNLGKESIIFYEDISNVVSGPVLLHYPTDLESQLFDAIRIGDKEQVSQHLYPFLAEMMGKNKNSMNFEVMLVRLVNNLIQLEQQLGINVLLTQDNHKLYHTLLDIRNPEEVERMLVDQVIYPMVNSMWEKTNNQFRGVSEQIIAIVSTEYDQELTLEIIGERLHYSPNYLSRIFKKEYGTVFSEYLKNYRLEIAKKWLTETDMTVKEIAERLQYNNPQNFIRSFRKEEHVTPGIYRKRQVGD